MGGDIDIRKDNNKISLNKSTICWICRDSWSTLKELKKALSSNLVGAGRVAQDLEKKFKKKSGKAKKHQTSKTANNLSFTDTNFTLAISKMSYYHTEAS